MAEEDQQQSKVETKPSGPKWLIGIASFLTLIVVITTSLDTIQTFLCHHGLDWLCPKEKVQKTKVELEIGSWLYDIGSGWKVVITNPTEYSAEVVNANLKFNDPSLPVLLPVLAGPEDWRPPKTCQGGGDHIVRDVILQPKSTTPLRMILYAAEIRDKNEEAMTNIDKTIQDACTTNANSRSMFALVTVTGIHW